jgi:hypothetical protein
VKRLVGTVVLTGLALMPDGFIRFERARRKSGQHRLAVGPVEIAVNFGKQPMVDLLLPPPLGSFLTATWVRDPDTMPDVARQAITDGRATSRWIVLNTRPVFFGLLGQNIVEVGVWRRGGVLTWFENDMRRLARTAPGPDKIEDAGPVDGRFRPDPYTSEQRLCDDGGMVSAEPTDRVLTYLDRLNDLRALTGLPRVTEGFACTGSAHLAGEHIRCTSPAHIVPAKDANPWPANPEAFVHGPAGTCT